MSELKNDQEIDDKREPLKQEDITSGDELAAPLRDQIVANLRDFVDEEELPQKLSNTYSQAMADQAEWLARQQVFIKEVDEFVEPIYDPATDWSSTLHLPTTLSVLKNYHSRFFAALMGTRPSFTMHARKAAFEDRAPTTQRLMEYNIREYNNEGIGVENEVDKWIWSWCSTGVGYLKSGWRRRFTRYEDVELVPVTETKVVVGPNGDLVPQEVETLIEQAVEKVEKVVDCPTTDFIDIEDIVVVGGDGCPQKADKVFHRSWLTQGELYSLADQGIFDAKTVEKIIDTGGQKKSAAVGSDIKHVRASVGAESSIDKAYDETLYEIVECHFRHPVDKSGIPSDLVVWIHKDVDTCLGASYLRRITKTNLRPFAKIEFYKRNGTGHAAGLPELLYSLSKEIDAIHNIRLDVGILQSMPFGYYRPNGMLSDEKMPVEPGIMFPLNDPSRDVFFPNIGNKVSFGFQEEQSLMGYVERVASMSDLNMGLMSGAQGATRTATGSRLLAGESSANMDIFLQRLNRGWKHYLMYQWGQLQERVPAGFEFRVFGETGSIEYLKIRDRMAIAGEFDFELEPNSANSNPQLQLQQAGQVYQMTQNPLDIQLGIVTASNRYEAIKNYFQALGIRDTSRFMTKPEQHFIKLSPLEILNRVLSGQDVGVDPRLDWQGFLSLVQEFSQNDELLGQFSQTEAVAMQAKALEAQAMLAAMQQAQNDAMVARQANSNAEATFGGGLTANINANVGDLSGEI